MIITLNDPTPWNEIVHKSRFQYYTFLYEWMEIFADIYNFEMYPLANEEKGENVSVFPVLYDKEAKKLASPMFGGWGGATREQDYPSYLKYIKTYGKKFKATEIEIYMPPTMSNYENFPREGFILSKSHYFILDINNRSFEEISQKITKYTRKNVRRALRDGVELIRGPISKENVLDFYPCYEDVMENRNAKLVFPIELFYSIAEKLPDIAEITLAKWNNLVIAGAITFTYADRVMMWFVVGKKEYWKLRANSLLFSDIIENAVSRGLNIVDFGPSAIDSSGADFKLKFGAIPEVHYKARYNFSVVDRIKTRTIKGIREMDAILEGRDTALTIHRKNK